MRKQYHYPLSKQQAFVQKLLSLSTTYPDFILLQSNYKQNKSYPYVSDTCLAAFGTHRKFEPTINTLSTLNQLQGLNDWVFGHISYDLKNEIEALYSNNADRVQFPLVSFFIPKIVIEIKHHEAIFHYLPCTNITDVIDNIEQATPVANNETAEIKITPREERHSFIETIKNIQQHIYRGNIYEINYCTEFFSTNTPIKPEIIYQRLNNNSSVPFSAYYKNNDKYVMSGSPERYLKKHENKLISQPIKGTAKRLPTKNADAEQLQQLIHSEKESTENIMIVDLVRNDLSKCACRNTVKVEELCGAYTFTHWHQLISTISCTLKPHISFADILRHTFPMGSMTGAPKIKAMQLIEKYEKTKRGLYSGTIGYIAPNGNFDFNVVIRSIMYNATNKYLSFLTGGAITASSLPEQEYDECLLKSESMRQALNPKNK